MKWLAAFATGLALGLALALVMHATRSPAPSHARGEAPIQDVLQYHAKALGLDQGTLDQCWAIADGARDELDAYRSTIRTEKQALARILDAAEVDREGMADAIARISAAEARLRTRELELMLEIRALLEPEQLEALKKLAPPPPPPPPSPSP